MNAPLTLEIIASDPNWMSFAKALRLALQMPETFGCTDADHLLANVAKLRSVDTASLRIPLAAVHWMETHAPKALEEENRRVPMYGVLILSQIYNINNSLAEEIAPKFFRRELKGSDLQRTLRELEASQGGKGVAGHERVKKYSAFEVEVFQAIAAAPHLLEMGADLQIERGDRNAIVPADIVISRDGRPIAAIEVKSYRQKTHHRYLLETVAMAKLLAEQYSSAILVVPGNWGDAITTMAELIRKLLVENVRLAVLHRNDDGQRREALEFVDQ